MERIYNYTNIIKTLEEKIKTDNLNLNSNVQIARSKKPIVYIGINQIAKIEYYPIVYWCCEAEDLMDNILDDIVEKHNLSHLMHFFNDIFKLVSYYEDSMQTVKLSDFLDEITIYKM